MRPKEDTERQPLRFAFSKIRRTWSFHVVVLQTTAKKRTKIQNARAKPLFCSLNLLFVRHRRGLQELPIYLTEADLSILVECRPREPPVI